MAKTTVKCNKFYIILFSILIIFIFQDLIFSLFEDHNNLRHYGLIIAHRGASGLAPENTLAAIKKAIELKADIIEVDVHQTKDSVVVIIHDRAIDRTTNGEGKIENMYYNQIRQYDAGEWFNSSFRGEKIPTLDEVLSLVNGQTKLMIEIKGNDKIYPNIEYHTYKLLKQHNALNWCIIHSFNNQVLHNFHELDSNLVLNKLLVMDFPYIPILIDNSINFGKITGYKNEIKAININSHFISNRLLKHLHESGFEVNVWTVNDSSKIEEFFRMGIDGVITNYPNYKRRSP